MKKKPLRSNRDLVHKAGLGDAKAAFQLYENYRDGSSVEEDESIADDYANKAMDIFREQSLHITSLRLVNFRAFQSIDLSFSERTKEGGNLTVLVGINGAGKTTILDAIAYSLRWVTLRILRPPNSGKAETIGEKDIHLGNSGQSEYASAVLDLQLSPELEYQMELSKAAMASNGSRRNDVEAIGQLARLYKLANVKDPNFNMPIMAYYGVERTLGFKQKGINKVLGDIGDTQSKFDGYDKALNANIDFVAFFKWFKYQTEVAGLEVGEPKRKAIASLEVVSRAIAGVMPSLQKLRIQRSPVLDMLVDKDGLQLSVDQLSQGEKSLLSLVFDITRRLIMLNPDVSKVSPLEGCGVILIDEIDLHLHPAWQQQVVPNLAKTFSNVQFIVTTHSPQVLSTVRREKIRLLGRNIDGNVVVNIPSIHTYGEPSNDVMQALMEVDPQPPIPEKSDLERLTTLVDQGLYGSEEAMSLRRSLEQRLNKQHPQFGKMDRSIRRQRALTK